MNLKKILICSLIAFGSISLASCGKKTNKDKTVTEKAYINVENGTGSGEYTIGTQATITADPRIGHEFKEWQVNGEVVSTSNPYTFTVTKDENYEAIYSRLSDEVLIRVSGGEGTGYYKIGESVTVTAHDKKEAEFLYWTVDDQIVSTEKVYTFIAQKDLDIRAEFKDLFTRVYIKSFKGGYGDEWLKELVSKFNEIYKSQNIVAEIVESSSLVTENAKREIYDTKRNQIDLYFTNGLDYSVIIDQSKQILKTDSKTLLANLDDVLDSKAIGLDGKEEEQTIKSRLFSGMREVSTYNGNNTKWQNQVFKLPWADAMTGLFANKSILNRYGIELPLTSDELVSAIEQISTHTAADNVYPYSWGGSNTPGYWSFLFETWFAQYSGVKKYENFQKCQPETGTIKDNGYEVYQDIGIKKSLEAMYPMLQLKYSSLGSTSKDHIEAQMEFMNDKSAFIVNGDWVMNEMKELYSDKASDIVYVQTPILSTLGTENGLTDAQLHDVVKAIDEGKSDAEIKGLVAAATDAAIAKIRDARSIHCSIGAGHDMFIPSYSDAVDAAKMFIRFMYSNDGCNIFREKAWGNLPVHYTVKDPSKTTPFQASLDRVYNQGATQVISDNAEYNSIRSSAQIYLFNYSAWQHPNAFKNIIVNRDHAKEEVRNAFKPENMFQTEAQYVKDSWKSYMEKVI